MQSLKNFSFVPLDFAIYEKQQKSISTFDFCLGASLTLPETNIAPKNGGFQEESPFPGFDCQGLC